jgi:hypothetical protein
LNSKYVGENIEKIVVKVNIGTFYVAILTPTVEHALILRNIFQYYKQYLKDSNPCTWQPQSCSRYTNLPLKTLIIYFWSLLNVQLRVQAFGQLMATCLFPTQG